MPAAATKTEMIITRTFLFCAGHRLYRPDWSDERNAAVFGLCANPAGHGHNYRLDVSVTGSLDRETGMILNLRQLKELVRDRVIADVDHKQLNVDVPWMRDVIPTTEEFAARLWQRIELALGEVAPTARLAEITLEETPHNRVRMRRTETAP